MPFKIIITGGAGFIGSAVIKQLEKEFEIFVIDNLSFGTRDLIKSIPDRNFYNADIRDKNRIKEIFKNVRPDWVIHLAAVHFIPYCNEHPFESADINISGTINVLEASKNAEIKKIFFASTAAVYPIYDFAVDESYQTGPLDIYGLSKLTGEELIRKFHIETGIESVICRFFNAFGPNETNPHLIPEIQKQVNEGLRTIKLGNLDPKRDFIHTYDMARAVELLMKNNIGGIDVFNLGRGIEYSVREIVESFERQLGEKITIEIDQNRVRKSDRMHLLANVAKLKNKTGWEPEWEIDKGIKTLIN